MIAALAAGVAFAAVSWAALRRRRSNVLRYSHVPFLIAAARPPIVAVVILVAARAVSLACIVAANLPAAIGQRDSATTIVCIDTSGSMSATDVLPSRAAAAASAIRLYVSRSAARRRIGLVVFNGHVRVLANLSAQRDALTAALARIPRANGQTAIGDALVAAATALSDSGPRAVVLVTDGVSNTGTDPDVAVRAYRLLHIRLDILGIGAHATSFDETALRRYARAAGGRYFRIASGDAVAPAIDAIVASESASLRTVDASRALAIVGGALLALSTLL